MIKAKSNITIRANIQKVWYFLEDFSLALSYNRFHKEIKTEKSFRMGADQEVLIKHNFGFGNIDMILNIENLTYPNKLVFSEKSIDENLNAFNHTTAFNIIKYEDSSLLTCLVEGSFGNKVADLSFLPILKAVTIEDLRKIKKAIESSEDNFQSFKNKQYNPI